MKSMKGKILKKLKTIKPIGHLKQDRVLQVNSSDGFVENFPKASNLDVQTPIGRKETGVMSIDLNSVVVLQEPEMLDVTKFMRDLEDDIMEFDKYIEDDDKENIGPPPLKRKDPVFAKEDLVSEAPTYLDSVPENVYKVPLLEIEISSFRRPELCSSSLFDPNLLAAFEQAVMEHTRLEKEINFGNSRLKVQRVAEENSNPLFCFEEKCPPGGSESVILYTTSLRGIRKTFEDCHSVRFLLESFRILFHERDVSMHSEFREELWKILDGKNNAVLPRLFIKGRYIGGAEEVLVLHEQGKFRPLFDGVPSNRSNGCRCDGCAGFRFVVCFNCSGSRKVIDGSSTTRRSKCPDCNENGLIICPLCC